MTRMVSGLGKAWGPDEKKKNDYGYGRKNEKEGSKKGGDLVVHKDRLYSVKNDHLLRGADTGAGES